MAIGGILVAGKALALPYTRAGMRHLQSLERQRAGGPEAPLLTWSPSGKRHNSSNISDLFPPISVLSQKIASSGLKLFHSFSFRQIAHLQMILVI